jgi:transcriptional regulator with XRE-family HTH domain
MTLGEKLRCLREVEGTLRGFGRAMTQSEVARAVAEEHGQSISQAYLSQVENGKRKHLTETSRSLLARFFNVHPGHLVSDPEGFQTELISGLRVTEDNLDSWLTAGAERFASDAEVSRALQMVAGHEDSRRCLILLAAIIELPELGERLLQVLKPEAGTARGGGAER